MIKWLVYNALKKILKSEIWCNHIGIEFYDESEHIVIYSEDHKWEINNLQEQINKLKETLNEPNN